MDKDLAFGSATLALSAGYYWMARSIPPSQLADAIGPQGLPKTYAILLAALSLVLVGRSLARRERDDPTRESAVAPRQPRALWRVGGMLAIGIVYVLAAPWLGYLLSIAALILTTTYYQGGAINRQVALVAVAGAIFFWVLFVLIMRIPQPAGLWPSLL